jgi:hypothetical protein
MTDQIKYSAEFNLSVPTGDILKSILVDIQITPPSGSVIIYGTTSSTSLQPIQVNGSRQKAELPFINGHLYVTYLGTVSDCVFVTHGWRDAR